MINNGEIGCMVLVSWAYPQMEAAGENGADIGYMPFPITVNDEQYASASADYSYGINVNATIALTFAIGSGLGAIAGVIYGCAYSLITPYIGLMLGIKAFIAAVLGGIGSVPGAMVGGLMLGVAESLTIAYISSDFSDAVVFGILILVLLVKPAGLFGKNVREKV